MSEERNKYKMLKNFMMNELGITREDIREWVKEAAADTAQKVVGQLDIDGIAERIIKREMMDFYGGVNSSIKQEIGSRIAARLEVKVKE